MKALIKRVLRQLVPAGIRDLVASVRISSAGPTQIAQVLLTQHYRGLVARKEALPTFRDVGFRCHSQFEEDGILLYIFALIGASASRTSVEICAGNGLQCNTTNLIVNHGWNGFLFDGDSGNVEVGKRFFAQHKDTFLCPPRFVRSWITAENVNDVVTSAGVQGDIDLLSLDIDGMDYWVWKSLECVRPRVVVCETHNVIPPDRALTAPYSPDFRASIPGFHSASLAAMTKLGDAKGYRLVGTHRYGFNAFFVRKDLAAC